MKERLKRYLHDVNLLCKYGFTSWKKEIENREYHKPVGQEIIRQAHIVPEQELDRQRAYEFQRKVKFSIITPLYNTPAGYLTELIGSLQRQTYGNWELCLADGSDRAHSYVGEICRKYQKEDTRIRYKALEKNGGISENTNACLKLATGEYYGLLDHDDVLHPAALFEVMSVIEKTEADFVYTDEVKFSGDIEQIQSPAAFNFKPDFGKYDLRSHNFICHFTVFHKDLLEGETRLYRSEFDGSQDHDMVLRLTEKARRIVHIPKVLYYWRLHSNSVSMDLSSKNYAVDAALRAVSAQLARAGESGTVRSNLPFLTIYRIRYEIEGQPLVSVVLHHAKHVSEIKRAVEEVAGRTDYRPLEFVYAGTEGQLPADLPADIRIKAVELQEEAETGGAWNRMIGYAAGAYIILLDVRSIPLMRDWIEELLMLCQRKDVCAAGPEILYRDGRIAYGGGALWKTGDNGIKIIGSHDKAPDMGYEALLCHVRNTTFSLAACMMFSRKVWEEIGGFSEETPGYEDVAFCLKGLEMGKNNVWTCFSKLQFGGSNIMPARSEKEKRTFEITWGKHFEQEKYFHPNWEKLKLV